MKSAQARMTTANDATAKQIAANVVAIDQAVHALAALSNTALPHQTAVWVAQTDAYTKLIQDGAKAGNSTTDLLLVAHGFNSGGYQQAAKAVAAYFTTSCP